MILFFISWMLNFLSIGYLPGVANVPSPQTTTHRIEERSEFCLLYIGNINCQTVTADSLIGRYLSNTGARSLIRNFATTPETPTDMGPPRLVVSVTRDSFSQFRKIIEHGNLLSHHHNPNQFSFRASFRGFHGEFGRLNEPELFSYPGVLYIPIILSGQESRQTADYFSFAAETPYEFDIARFPWLLRAQDGTPYRETRSNNSRSDWFLFMPVGAYETNRPSYDRNTVLRDATSAGAPITSSRYWNQIRQVWSSPLAANDLGQVLLDQTLSLHTTGRIAWSLLGTTPVTRVPVIFRLFENHSDLTPDFPTWIQP